MDDTLGFIEKSIGALMSFVTSVHPLHSLLFISSVIYLPAFVHKPISQWVCSFRTCIIFE